jgi:hypothetical protein
MARVVRPGGTVTDVTWAGVEHSPGYDAMVGLLRRLFGEEAADALLAPFALGRAEELRGLLAGIADDVSVVQLDGEARFDSLDGWLHTEIRGWTLAGMISDAQFETLRTEARRDLARFVGDDGHVRFPAPALLATAKPPGRT